MYTIYKLILWNYDVEYYCNIIKLSDMIINIVNSYQLGCYKYIKKFLYCKWVSGSCKI